MYDKHTHHMALPNHPQMEPTATAVKLHKSSAMNDAYNDATRDLYALLFAGGVWADEQHLGPSGNLMVGAPGGCAINNPRCGPPLGRRVCGCRGWLHSGTLAYCLRAASTCNVRCVTREAFRDASVRWLEGSQNYSFRGLSALFISWFVDCRQDTCQRDWVVPVWYILEKSGRSTSLFRCLGLGWPGLGLPAPGPGLDDQELLILGLRNGGHLLLFFFIVLSSAALLTTSRTCLCMSRRCSFTRGIHPNKGPGALMGVSP